MTEVLPIGTVLYKTRDFDVVIGISEAPELPQELRKLYFVKHRDTDVVAGRTNHLAEALYSIEYIQSALDSAIKNPKQRPKQELSEFEKAALLQSVGMGGERN